MSASQPKLQTLRVQEELALGLKPFEAFGGCRWVVCGRPKCLDLAKKYDNENRQL